MSDLQNSSTIFHKILNGQIPCTPVFENEYVLAFHDINPQAPIHILIIPKQPIINLGYAQASDQSLLGELLLTAQHVAKEQGIGDNFRVIINSGEKAGQTIFYLHVHVLGGTELGHLC